MGEARLQALIQKSLSVATRTKAIKPSELSRVIVDMTVQPKNVTFPTDAKLLNRALEKLVRLAQCHGVCLRQSSGKSTLIQHQRYAYAKQFKRANRMLRKLRTDLGRVIRYIGRKIEGNGGLEGTFAKLLALARRVGEQQQRQHGPKVYSLHAPEVECIGRWDLMARKAGQARRRTSATTLRQIDHQQDWRLIFAADKQSYPDLGLRGVASIEFRYSPRA